MFCIADDQQRMPENQYLDALKNKRVIDHFLERARSLSILLLT